MATDSPISPFAAETTSTVLSRMLASVNASFNRDPGDVIYDLLVPAATETARIYDGLDAAFQQLFISTATGANLTLLASQLFGMSRIASEPDASLRSRLQIRAALPRSGGNEADWIGWALEVPGVAWAGVTEAAGVITVYVAPDRETLVPTGSPFLATTDAYLQSKKPAGAVLLVAGLTPWFIDISLSLTLESALADVPAFETEIFNRLAAYFNVLAPVNGVSIVANELLVLLMTMTNIVDVTSLALAETGTVLLSPVVGTGADIYTLSSVTITSSTTIGI